MQEEVNLESIKKPLFKKWWFWMIFAVAFVATLVGGYNVWKNWKFAKGLDDKFITSAPIDLTQIYGISPFRSCMGHDYSAKNVDGVVEEKRSMKHYVQPLSKFNDTNDQVKLYAPFDGKVARNDCSKDSSKTADKRMGGCGFDIYPLASDMWTMEFGHVYSLETLKVGSKFKAGDLLGYAYVQDTGSSFDLALWTDNKYSRSFNGDDDTATLDSIFNHMTSDVLAQFTRYTSLDKLIITKEYRDANICQEVDRGVNARGEKETAFASNGEGDSALQVMINPDPEAQKNTTCLKNSDCSDGKSCLFKDGDPEKGVCTVK